MILPTKIVRMAMVVLSSTIWVSACGGGSDVPPSGLSPDSTPVIPLTNDNGMSESPLGDFVTGNGSLNVDPSNTNSQFEDAEMPLENTVSEGEVQELLESSSPSGIELSGAEAQEGSVVLNDIVFYETDSATSIIVLSNEGDADLIVENADGDIVCTSNSFDRIDTCSNLVVGERYLISVVGFTEAVFEIFSSNTPPIMGNSSLAAEISASDRLIFVGSGFTAANLISFQGDADLLVVNTANEPVCASASETGFDSCNNVDGSSGSVINKNDVYLILVDGFTDAAFELKTFDTDVLTNNVPVPSFVELDEEDVYFAQGISTVELSTFSGDADLEVYNPQTNEAVCFSFEPNTDADACSVPEGNYRIEVIGHQASDFSLVAF